MDILKIFSKSS